MRLPNFRPEKKEEFEKEFEHKVMRNNKADEKHLQESTGELQSKVQAAECRSEARETKRMEMEDSSSQRCRAWEKPCETGAFSKSPHRENRQLRHDVGMDVVLLVSSVETPHQVCSNQLRVHSLFNIRTRGRIVAMSNSSA